MKRFFSALCALALLGSLAACQTAPPAEEPTAPAATQPITTATTVPTTTATTTAPAAALTIVAEMSSYYGIEARYNISQLPEAKIITDTLETAESCTHGYTPMMGGTLFLHVSKNDATATYALTTCSNEQPVLYDKTNVYHLAQEIHDPISEYLRTPEAQINFVSAQATHGDFTFRSEDAAVLTAVQTLLDNLTPGGKHDATTDACQKDWYVVCYQDTYSRQYAICTVKNDDGTVNVAYGYPGSDNTWYTAPGEILDLLR